MTFLREHPDQTLLVHATREQTGAGRSPPHRARARGHALHPLLGPPASLDATSVTLPGDGPGVSVYARRGR